MPAVTLALVLLGVAVLAAGIAAVRISGAWNSIARRLGGAREVRVGDLVTASEIPSRPVRVVGRIRCGEPLVTDRGDRLVVVHRDVEIRLPDGSWRTVERLRESRGFDLWDHDGSTPVDPALAAEPLVTIPHVWRGSPDELTDERYRAAIGRIEAEHGTVTAARSTTRMVSVVERLQVLAIPSRDPDGTLTLVPPRDGFVISTLELDAAMRLLAGPRRRLLLAGVGLVAIGTLAVLAGLLGLGLDLLA